MCGCHKARHLEQIPIPSWRHPRHREGNINSDSAGNEITETIFTG